MKTEASKRLILTQIFIIFILPVFLLYYNVFTHNWRFILLAVSSLAIYGIIRHEKWTYEDMGIRHDNLKKEILIYSIFTILGLMALYILGNKLNLPDKDTPSFLIKTWVFFLPICFFQEFAFRSFLMPRLQRVFSSSFTVIFINTLLFTLMHIIYPNMFINIPLVFVSGILFAWLYYKYPNFLLISISHSILNVTALLLGFF